MLVAVAGIVNNVPPEGLPLVQQGNFVTQPLAEALPHLCSEMLDTRSTIRSDVFDSVDDTWFIATLSAIAALDSVASSGAGNMPASSVDEQWLVTLH